MHEPLSHYCHTSVTLNRDSIRKFADIFDNWSRNSVALGRILPHSVAFLPTNSPCFWLFRRQVWPHFGPIWPHSVPRVLDVVRRQYDVA